MGWRYNAGLVLIVYVVLIWVTSAEVTQVCCPRASLASVHVIVEILKGKETKRRNSCNSSLASDVDIGSSSVMCGENPACSFLGYRFKILLFL